MERKTVEVLPAYEFICDDCGRNNYGSLIHVESDLQQEELDDFYRKVHDDAPPSGTCGYWYMLPDSCKCQFCHAEFDTFNKTMEDTE